MNEPLFQRINFTLPNGTQAYYKIECDALTEEDWATLALLISERVPQFGRVYGVPRGGIPLERALKEYTVDYEEKVLVVDDVWDSGTSLERFINELFYRDRQGDVNSLKEEDIIRAVVFARNKTPDNVFVLFQMN